MPGLETLLDEIERLNDSVRPREAEERMRALFETLGGQELRAWEVDIRRTIDQFLPKRRKSLSLALDERLRRLEVPEEPVAPIGAFAEPAEISDQMEVALRDLSDHHIFQWSTYYRDVLSAFFDQLYDSLVIRGSGAFRSLSGAHKALGLHSSEIFTKGYQYQTARKFERHEHAISQSLSGLQRFLDLPLEFYSTKLPHVLDVESGRALRTVCSMFLEAVLEGFSLAQFGTNEGSLALVNSTRTWVHALAFCNGRDVARLMSRLPDAAVVDQLITSVQPVAEALDELVEGGTDYAPIPALARFAWDFQRLEISLHPPRYSAEPQPIEIQCYLDPSLVQQAAIREAVARDVALVVAPLRPDLQAAIADSEVLAKVVVATISDLAPVGLESERERASVGTSSTRRRIIATLGAAIYRRRSARAGTQPLQYNFAREFPLHDPYRTRYFHVHRSSVRELLRAFERRNGVRLWCSVRRSGKTTACMDLATTTGDSVVVSQTCAGTAQLIEDSSFYRQVCRALEDGSQLPGAFFADEVARASDSDGGRYVFILDEYETLFGRLKTAISYDDRLRYTVVQPLLDQMVAFTQSNLLVFLGQQPNAHFILMDQNQLSAYVEQDPFPLFRHQSGSVSTEFAQLIRKVFADRATFDSGFADALYSETSGHPYLTVNLLVELVEWLIETGRPVGSLDLTEDDFARFATSHLKPKRLQLSPEYRFFREAIAEATSPVGFEHSRWLFGVYSCLRELMLSGGVAGAVGRHEFAEIVDRLDLGSNLDAEQLLATASQSNFLDYDAERVWPRIRLLARLAAATKRRTGK